MAGRVGAAMLPEPPTTQELARLGIRPDEYASVGTGMRVWRVHRTTGERVTAWNRFRTFGPVLRFDHHPLPPETHSAYGVWYGACDAASALAEAFQTTRVIDRHLGDPRLTCLQLAPVLLDVSGEHGLWPTRAGGNFALNMAPHPQTQAWARAISQTFTQIDGLMYTSRWGGGKCIVLWQRRDRELFPPAAEYSWHLADTRLTSRIAAAAHRIGYDII